MLEEDVKIIKIGEEAIFEFIYENFVEKQELYFDCNSLDVASTFAIDWENRKFIFGVYKIEDNKGNFIGLPKQINLDNLIKNLPDTTFTMFSASKRYCKYTKQQLIDLSKFSS